MSIRPWPIEDIGDAVRKRFVVGDVDRERFKRMPPLVAIAATVFARGFHAAVDDDHMGAFAGHDGGARRPIPEPAPVTSDPVISGSWFHSRICFSFSRHEHAGGQDEEQRGDQDPGSAIALISGVTPRRIEAKT